MQVYAVSSQAKDIRSVVMDLNKKRGESAELPGRAEACAVHAKPPIMQAAMQWTDYLAQVQQQSQNDHWLVVHKRACSRSSCN